MIKLKNILAENMRRFGTKNLREDVENKNDLIILKNLTSKRHDELVNWMKRNLTTEPYNFGLLWQDGPLRKGEFGLQIDKFNQKDIPVLMKYLDDNGYDYDLSANRDPKTGNVSSISTFKDLEAALEDNLKDFVGDDVFYTTDENDDIVYVEILAGSTKNIVLNIIKNTLKTASYKIDDIERSPDGDINFSIVKR